jgi:glucosyl-3-phosphoglycerate synthase
VLKKFHHREFDSTEQLYKSKLERNLKISVVMPALNEESTIGKIVEYLYKNFVKDIPLIDELVVIDNNSIDKTSEVARLAGASVFNMSKTGPDVAFGGKGVALWKSQFITSGDILLFLDSDILQFDKRFVNGLLGPLILDDSVLFVKSFYKRPLMVENGTYENYGGRVTEIMVRPLLSALIPELTQVIQPLAGEYAIRRDVAESVPFWSGYGVEIGLLFDISKMYGLSNCAQVDMDLRCHRNRNVYELGKMSFAILQVIFKNAADLGIMTFNKELFTTLHSANAENSDSYHYNEVALPPKRQIEGSYVTNAIV